MQQEFDKVKTEFTNENEENILDKIYLKLSQDLKKTQQEIRILKESFYCWRFNFYRQYTCDAYTCPGSVCGTQCRNNSQIAGFTVDLDLDDRLRLTEAGLELLVKWREECKTWALNRK